MSARDILKTVEKFTIDNSPAIMTALGVAGSIGTAVLTGKATFKAAHVLEVAAYKDVAVGAPPTELTKQEKFGLVWKLYVPPAATLVATCSAIIAANYVSSSRAAALAAAYKLSQKQIDDYKEKVLEKFGIKDEKAARDEINAEYVRKNPPSDDVQVLATEDEQIFLESWTGRYFRSKMHIVKAAENKINATLLHETYATLSDFYDELGLARTQVSAEVGWSMENQICLDFTTALADGGTRPVIVMEYMNMPTMIRDYIRNGNPWIDEKSA